MKNMKIDANGTEIREMCDVANEEAYISLTDIAKYKNSDNAFIVVANWMRNHSAISFLGLWEQIHNPNFKPIEFDRFKTESGDNVFTLTQQQWIKATDATVAENNNNRMLHNKKENEMYADLDEILQWAENNYVDVYMPIISRKEYKMVDRALRLS